MPRMVHVDLRLGNATKSLALSLSSDDQPVLKCSGAASFFFSGGCAGESWSRLSDCVTVSSACATIIPDVDVELVSCAAAGGALHADEQGADEQPFHVPSSQTTPHSADARAVPKARKRVTKQPSRPAPPIGFEHVASCITAYRSFRRAAQRTSHRLPPPTRARRRPCRRVPLASHGQSQIACFAIADEVIAPPRVHPTRPVPPAWRSTRRTRRHRRA